ncbi:MAG: CDP-glucose 4,6-dehydratase [Paracoccaceae bacterium]
MTPGFWKNRRVLVTGHTGFKGAWLCMWLTQMGAKVSGLSKPAEGDPNLWNLLNLTDVKHYVGDVSDLMDVENVLAREQPQIVLHLAAQALVRRSYKTPLETFSTNVMGVVALLDAITRSDSVHACVIVTSDKCYQNKENNVAFKETDPMGGDDPYSGSKGAAELATSSMRHSFFASHTKDGHRCNVASARAGNVIGGGDWSEDRLIPDIIRGCLGPDQAALIRSPKSVRPWQHVLEPLHGYLLLAEKLCVDGATFAQGWNFGPTSGDERPVIDVADAIVKALGKGCIEIAQNQPDLHEAKLLTLDSTKAKKLGWSAKLDFATTVEMTASWYGDWAVGGDPASLCREQIKQYLKVCGAEI